MALNGGAQAPGILVARRPRLPRLNSIGLRGGVGTAIARPAMPKFGGIGTGVGAALRRTPNAGNNGGAAPFVIPKAAAPPVAAPATPAPAASSFTPKPPPDPRDADYFNNLASDEFQANAQINGLNQTSTYERAALAEALRRWQLEQPDTEHNATTSANAGGLLYSGALGRQIGDIRTDYLRKQTDAQTGFDRAETGRRSEIAQIQGALRFQATQRYLDAIARQAERDVDSPLVEPPVPAAATAAVAQVTKPKARTLRAKNVSAAARAAAEAKASAEKAKRQQAAQKKARK